MSGKLKPFGLRNGENKAAYRRIKTIDWKKYPYTSIAVLGAGPENYEQKLNPVAKISLRNAALNFRNGEAPYIILTGGKVHPYKTQIVEAIQMKQYLMFELSIPDENIIIEPHARHTTSNLRNIARLTFRSGMPMDKPIQVCSSESHIKTISGEGFEKRCLKELKYIPYRMGEAKGRNFVAMYPLQIALQINSD